MRHVTSPDDPLLGLRAQRRRVRPLALVSTPAVPSASIGAPAALGQEPDVEPDELPVSVFVIEEG